MNKKLLEVYIKHIIDESLKSTFIDPFTDIVKTAAYGIEDVSARTQTLFKTIVKGLPTLFVPFLDYDYKSFREEEKANLEKIKSKYADVLDKYGWRDNEAWDEFLLPAQAKELRGNKAAIKELNEWCDDIRDDQRVMLFNAWGKIVQESVLYPVNLAYLTTQVMANFKIDKTAKTDLSPLYVARTVGAVLRESGRRDPRTGEMRTIS